MNSKTCKEISRQTDKILIEWLKTLLPEKDHAKIDTNNVYQYLPDANYFYTNKTLRLSFYAPKWVRKNVKKLVKAGYSIDKINMDLIEKVVKSKR